MNRCALTCRALTCRALTRRALTALAASLLLASATAVLAQLARPFPASALRGELLVTASPEALLNRQPVRLAPGARIRDGDNRLVLSGRVVGHKLLVHYTRDLQGNLLEVWVLTAAEAAKKPWPTTPAEAATWRFDAAAQAWSRP
jgi:hypothetical protein